MADILIRMDMPKRCNECPMINCVHDNQGYFPRPDKCPLQELPPHGRMIDESWVIKAMITTLEALKKNPKMDGQEMHLIAAFDTLRAMLDDAPTIIPASEVKDNG